MTHSRFTHTTDRPVETALPRNTPPPDDPPVAKTPRQFQTSVPSLPLTQTDIELHFLAHQEIDQITALETVEKFKRK